MRDRKVCWRVKSKENHENVECKMNLNTYLKTTKNVIVNQKLKLVSNNSKIP